MESKSRKAIAYVLVVIVILTQTAFSNVFDIDTTMTVTEEHEELTVFSNNIVDLLDLAIIDDSVNGLSIAASDSSAVTSVDDSDDVSDTDNAGAQGQTQADAAEETQTEETETVPPSPYDGKIVVNVDDYLTMREAPTTDAAIVGKLYAGSSADIVEEVEGWTLVTSGSVTGYVCNGYFETGANAEALAQQVGRKIGTVTTDTLRIRSEANTESDIVDLAALGQQLDVVGEQDGWYSIQYSSDIVAYVSGEFVTVELVLGQAVSIEEELAEQKRIQEEEEAARLAKEKEEADRIAAEQAAANASKQVTVTTTQQTPVAQASYDDAYLLACLVSMEAGGECYEGKLAVASVVMNRVNSPVYPNTISGVIYQSGQFTGANTGLLAGILASGPSNSECYQAANDALAGINNAGTFMNFMALYKANTSNYSEYMIIGNHCFYKR